MTKKNKLYRLKKNIYWQIWGWKKYECIENISKNIIKMNSNIYRNTKDYELRRWRFAWRFGKQEEE